MATGMYAHALERFLTGQIDWLTEDAKVVIVDHAEYEPNLDEDISLEDIPGAARVAVSDLLTGKTATDGVANAANVTFTALTGPVSEGVVVYIDSGTESSSFLICHIDEGTSFPIVPDGEDFVVEWSSGENGIFRL